MGNVVLAMEEILWEGKNFKLANETELPGILDFLGNFLPDSIKFHQTLKTFMKDRVWEFHFYINKSWPQQAVTLHFPGMTKTVKYLSDHPRIRFVSALARIVQNGHAYEH